MPRALAFSFAVLLASPAFAQQQPPRPAPPAQPAAAQAAPASSPAQPQPQQQQPQLVRTEILNFDNWTVTCRDYAGPQSRQCAATIQLVQLNQQTGQATSAITWVIQLENGRLNSVMQTPTGVTLAPGVEIKIGATPRKGTFLRCDPQRCEAGVAIDDAFSRDLAGANDADVTVVGTAGNAATFKLPLRGYDRAIQALRR